MTPHDQQRFGRITLVGLIIAIFGVAFMFGGTSRYFGVASAFGMGTGGAGRRHKVWLSDRLESETDQYARMRGLERSNPGQRPDDCRRYGDDHQIVLEPRGYASRVSGHSFESSANDILCRIDVG
jgi:hypothetical protein